MPGESNGFAANPTNGSASERSELDDLFETASSPKPEVSTEYECAKCGTKCSEQCPTCQGPFCVNHTSPLDARYCNLCLPDNTITESPLTDSDGHVVNGRHLTVGPRYMTISRSISEMSDDELARFISTCREEIALTVRALDFRRLNLGTAQMEQTQRAEIKRRELRLSKFQVKQQKAARPEGPLKQARSSTMADAMQKAIEYLMSKQQPKPNPIPNPNPVKDTNETN